MLAQARSIADLIRESGGHGFEVYLRWEDEVAARLLDNARWVARLDSTGQMRPADLVRWADLHHLGRINLFDARGEKVASSRVEEEEPLPARHDPRDFIGPVLRGEVRELRIGFKEARFRGGSRFAVAVARRNGGAIVVNVFADSMRATLESVQPGHLLRGLGSASGVRFVVLEGEQGLIAASPPLDSGVTLGRFPGLAPPDSEGAMRAGESDSPWGRVYEVVTRVHWPGTGAALLRIGLDPAPLDRVRAEVRGRAWLRALLFAVFSTLATVLLLAWQRHALLTREMVRVRAELEAREQEAQRTARLTAMGELASHVAHEIRNPLNTIHLTAQEMARDAQLPEELRKRAGDLRSESLRIETIVQQFLEFARPREPRLESVSVHDLIETLARSSRAAFAALGVELVVRTESATARLDPTLFAEIVDNLLRNAREASAPGTRVTLSSHRRGGEVEIAVEDQGPGVSPELRERVFDLYFTTKPQGTGLGLSLASQMATAMGGTLRLDHGAGSGARFVLHLPAERAFA